VVTVETSPPLQWVVMPRTPSHVVITVQITVGEDIQAGAFFVAYHSGNSVEVLLAEARIQHAGVERTPPHAFVEPFRTRP
jgi:hypothetical protein